MKCVIGYDEDYDLQYEICKSTINEDTEYTRNMILPHIGSTRFSMSRFLVPYQMQYSNWNIYCDSDFYFIEQPRSLLQYIDSKYALLVCKHPNYTPNSDTKMDDKKQTTYDRKNWSSLIVWNCSHPANKILTPTFVADCNPLYLHQFKWLDDSLIGSLPLEWNTLEGYYEFENPKAIHFTDGTPNVDKYSNTRNAKLWLDRYEFLLREGRITI